MFTGCDSVSAFKGKGKVKAITLLLGSEATVQVFRRLGCSWEVDDDLLSVLEQFTCQLYGEQSASVNDARYAIFTNKCRVDSGLPPNSDSLAQHSLWANYETAIYRRCLENFISAPTPVGRGWEVSTDDGKLTFTWMTLPVAALHQKAYFSTCSVAVRKLAALRPPVSVEQAFFHASVGHTHSHSMQCIL